MSTAPRVVKFCNYCTKGTKAKKFTGTSIEAVDAKIIKHFQEEHPLNPERCFDITGKTWLPGYDDSAKAFYVYKNKFEELEKEYKKEAAIRNTLATKLNAIIMVLENKQEFRA